MEYPLVSLPFPQLLCLGGAHGQRRLFGASRMEHAHDITYVLIFVLTELRAPPPPTHPAARADPTSETITFAMCAATRRLPNALQMDLFGPIRNINIARFCVKCVCNALYETFHKFCAGEYVFPYGLLKERQM